jgi:shikimate kinase
VVKSTSENALPQNSNEKETGLKTRPGNKIGAQGRMRVRPRPPATGAQAVFLVGFMGAGKSSVGRALAQQLNWLFEDLDDRIEQRERRTVAQIFRDAGESAFRQAEHAALKHALDDLRGGVSRIIALGGGAFAQPRNVALLQDAGVPTVFLDAPVAELWQRCCEQAKAAGTERPLLKNLKEFRKLYKTRRQHYARARVKADTSQRTVEAIAAEIAKKLKLKKIAIRTEEGEVE